MGPNLVRCLVVAALALALASVGLALDMGDVDAVHELVAEARANGAWFEWDMPGKGFSPGADFAPVGRTMSGRAAWLDAMATVRTAGAPKVDQQARIRAVGGREMGSEREESSP